MNKIYTFLVILVSTIFKTVLSDEKLNIDILYESLCPDSQRFISEQLAPNWAKLSPYANLNLIPFGKSASYENGTKFVCQHGPQECKGNRIMSCALKEIPDQKLQVTYTNCFMNTYRFERNNVEEFGQKCAEAALIDIHKVVDCYNSQEGTAFQLAAEKVTAQTAPKFVPTIVYNGKFVQELQDVSLVNFKGVVCEIVKNTHPGACQE